MKRSSTIPTVPPSVANIDEIILPRDTRYKLVQALEMAHNKNQSNPPKKHGNMPL